MLQMENPIYNLRSHGLDERALQTAMKSARPWNASLFSFYAFLQRHLLTHRNICSWSCGARSTTGVATTTGVVEHGFTCVSG